MYLEIVTPEAVILSAEVESVSVPGVEGQFQMLNNHAPIVSILTKGEVKVVPAGTEPEKLSKRFRKDNANPKALLLDVDGGIVEMKDNKVIVLAD